MKALRYARSSSVDSPRRIMRESSVAGFTLVELMVATTIFGLVMGLTLVAYTGVAKRAFHTEATVKGSSELRSAADLISQSVRSASQAVTVSANGLQLDVPPDALGVAFIVGPGSPIGALGDGTGYKDTKQMVKVGDYTAAVVTSSIFATTSRPTGALATSDVATYFKTKTYLADNEEIDLSDLFHVDDVVTIPATAYGEQVTLVINSVSNGKNSKTVTFTTKLGVDVPLGTRILPTSAGRRMRFEVVPDTAADASTRGQLRYYPDIRQTNPSFTVLAHDVDSSPLSNPAVPTSAVTTPFVLNGRYLTLNLQKLPRGTIAGRTVQGVQTTAYARTDPSVQ